MTRRILKIFLSITLLLSFVPSLKAQFDNEWIDHTRTYYRFKVGEAGLHRIPYSTLNAVGLGSVPAEYFQLWRMGKQVPLLISRQSGALGSDDFLEFYGEANDGSLDTKLYGNQLQPSDKISLFTDTAAYFLTVDPSGQSLRMSFAGNDLTGNTLTPEPFFLFTKEHLFRNRLHPGYGVNLGLSVYSSSFEVGEGWASLDILPGSPLTQDLGALHVASDGPDPVYRLSVFGNAANARKLRLLVNGTEAGSHDFSGMDGRVFIGNMPKSLLGRASDVVTVLNGSSVSSDHMMLHSISITYPRRFHFGGRIVSLSICLQPALDFISRSKDFNMADRIPSCMIDRSERSMWGICK